MVAPSPRQLVRNFKNAKHSGNHKGYVPQGRTGFIRPTKKRKDLPPKPERKKATLFDYILECK